MAHRTNVVQVLDRMQEGQPSEKVVDPHCGREMDRKAARHVLFRANETRHFCSRECMQAYVKGISGARLDKAA